MTRSYYATLDMKDTGLEKGFVQKERHVLVSLYLSTGQKFNLKSYNTNTSHPDHGGFVVKCFASDIQSPTAGTAVNIVSLASPSQKSSNKRNTALTKFPECEFAPS